jgi:hypothetical protein
VTKPVTDFTAGRCGSTSSEKLGTLVGTRTAGVVSGAARPFYLEDDGGGPVRRTGPRLVKAVSLL